MPKRKLTIKSQVLKWRFCKKYAALDKQQSGAVKETVRAAEGAKQKSRNRRGFIEISLFFILYDTKNSKLP